ncbi:hypothetical protein YQE_07914, partial [Dendroctonus ponderosae]
MLANISNKQLYSVETKSIGVQSQDDECVYFVAPDRFLGDQRSSYNQLLEFSLRIGDNRAMPAATDIILESNGNRITNTIFAQDNGSPTIQSRIFKFRLHEHPDFQWQPRLNSRDFISILTNLTAIKIRGTYCPKGVGFLDDVKLETAARGAAGSPALWLEFCECPQGTAEDCIPCNCPDGGACIQLEEELIMCTECPTGYSGHRCDVCSDGYFGDPTGRFGPASPCQVCECNQNIDTNAIGNCNTTTGECLRCINNAGGSRCEICLQGFYGNALLQPKGDCKRCQCYAVGTQSDPTGELICHSTTGDCACKERVVGKNCDKCEEGFYNLQSGEGCQSCNCDPVGSYNQTCDLSSGQCYCRPGVTGPRCDHCEARKYGFSSDGCLECDCDAIGSKDLQCDTTGQCPCLDNVEGRRCDKCKENKYDRHRGCVDCPDCYNLVQNAHNSHNDALEKLDEVLDEIERRPTVVADEEFPVELNKLQEDIDDLYGKVKGTSGKESIMSRVDDIRQREKEISRSLETVNENVDNIQAKADEADRNGNNTELLLEMVEQSLNDAQLQLEAQGKKALENAQQRSKQAGQQSQNMTRIAQEARELADILDDKASRLSVIKATISKIKSDLNKAEDKLNKTNDFTSEVNAEAREVKNEALELLNEGRDLLEKGFDQQQILTELVDDIHAANDSVVKTIDEWTEKLQETERIYEDLKFADSDSDTQKLRKNAEDALKTIPEIEAIINEALKEAADEQTVLEAISETATAALNTAEDAQDETERVSIGLQDLLAEAQALNKDADDLNKTDSEITQRVKESEDNLDDLLRYPLSTIKLVERAKENVGKAVHETGKVSEEVAQLLGDVQGIISELENTPDIDDETLDRLDLEIKTIERQINETKLEEELEKLEKQHKDQNVLIDDYKLKIAEMQDQVKNIMDIVNSLDDRCFKNVQLEP